MIVRNPAADRGMRHVDQKDAHGWLRPAVIRQSQAAAESQATFSFAPQSLRASNR
jgi:hypothetical protein